MPTPVAGPDVRVSVSSPLPTTVLIWYPGPMLPRGTTVKLIGIETDLFAEGAESIFSVDVYFPGASPAVLIVNEVVIGVVPLCEPTVSQDSPVVERVAGRVQAASSEACTTKESEYGAPSW